MFHHTDGYILHPCCYPWHGTRSSGWWWGRRGAPSHGYDHQDDDEDREEGGDADSPEYNLSSLTLMGETTRLEKKSSMRGETLILASDFNLTCEQILCTRTHNNNKQKDNKNKQKNMKTSVQISCSRAFASGWWGHRDHPVIQISETWATDPGSGSTSGSISKAITGIRLLIAVSDANIGTEFGIEKQEKGTWEVSRRYQIGLSDSRNSCNFQFIIRFCRRKTRYKIVIQEELSFDARITSHRHEISMNSLIGTKIRLRVTPVILSTSPEQSFHQVVFFLFRKDDEQHVHPDC